MQRDTGRRWAARPANTGLERDFYTLEDVLAGEDPAFIEKAFSKFEGEAAAVIGEIIDNRVIPKDKDKFDTLINFIALAASRVPGMRRLISKPLEDIAQMIAQMNVSTKERFEQSFKDAGIDPAAQGLTYEMACEFVQHGMTIRMTNATYIHYLMNVVEMLLPLLGARNWCVCHNDNAGEHFIVTDNPIAVTWSDTRPDGIFSPAFGKRETDVTVP